VYPPELFPTHLRASGVGLAVASSRFGSAISTFLLPLAVQQVGIHPALGVCVGVRVFGGVFCHVLAPETGSENLSDMKSDRGGDDEPATKGEHIATFTASSHGNRNANI
jgi:MFS transporter, putative metabolite transport protein